MTRGKVAWRDHAMVHEDANWYCRMSLPPSDYVNLVTPFASVKRRDVVDAWCATMTLIDGPTLGFSYVR